MLPSLIAGAIFMCAAVGVASDLPSAWPGRAPSLTEPGGYVLVTPAGPDDGGDFGPKTPGTMTSGIREALVHAKSHGKDVFIAGGAGGATYRLRETLRIPWFNDFRLDGGYYVLLYEETSGPAIVFDTQMNCHYRFGMIISRSNDAAVVFRPRTAGWDDLVLINTSEFYFNAIIGAGHVFPEGHALPGTDDLAPKPFGRGIGLLLDATAGPIDANRISVIETAACDVGVELRGATFNHLMLTTMHLCNTHISIDARSHGNRIEATINSQGVDGSTGVVISGRENLLTLNFLETAPNRNVVFEPPADGNLIIAIRLPNGITNNALRSANRIIRGDLIGFDTETPSVPESGAICVNENPFIVEVIILTPGSITEWALTDPRGNTQPVAAALSAGDRLSLDPGDGISLTYTDAEAPTWRWRARQ